jgi:membrane protease YdiL (CAAX protease family)
LETQRISIAGTIYSAIIAVTILMFIASVPFGAYAVFSPHLSTSGYTYNNLINFFPIDIGLFAIALPVTPSFGVLFVFLTALYLVFIGLAAVQGGGVARAFRSASREGIGALMRNPLCATVIILGASQVATVLLDLIQTSAGVSSGGLTGDPYTLLLSLILAPLVEEIGFRFFLIGVPLAILMLLFRADVRRIAKALWRPSAAWDGIGEGDPGEPAARLIKLLVYLLVIVSSILFGAAHYLAGGGWEIGKVSEAALGGFALAYLYMRYGLHASIIYHWALDFGTNAFAFYNQANTGVSWSANTAYSLIPALDTLLLVGLPGLLFFISLFFKWVNARSKDSSLTMTVRNPDTSPPPSTQAAPGA